MILPETSKTCRLGGSFSWFRVLRNRVVGSGFKDFRGQVALGPAIWLLEQIDKALVGIVGVHGRVATIGIEAS